MTELWDPPHRLIEGWGPCFRPPSAAPAAFDEPALVGDGPPRSPGRCTTRDQQRRHRLASRRWNDVDSILPRPFRALGGRTHGRFVENTPGGESSPPRPGERQ